VLARVVTHLLAFAAREGVNREALLEGAGLREAELTDSDSPVPFSALVALWQMIARAKGAADPDFGLRWGASLRVRDTGLLGYAMCYSATLAAALRRLVRYGRIITDTIQFDLEARGPHHQVVLAATHPALGAGLRFAVDGRIAALVGECRELTGVDVIPFEVTFTYAQPRMTALHREFFQCRLRFSHPVSTVVFHARDLRVPLLRADETLAGYLSDHAEHVLHTLVTGTSTRERVRSAIWAVLSEGRPTLDGVASALQVPSRTLQRRLAEEGSSLQAEVEHIRKAVAMAALRDRAMPIDEVAFLLGYTEPSTFYRSFKRWTGTTPDQYRTAAA
jgi:AraC-like DNA-binding protein